MVPTRSLLLVTQEIQNYISPYISKINPIFHGCNPPLRDNYPTNRRPLGAFAAYSPPTRPITAAILTGIIQNKHMLFPKKKTQLTTNNILS